MKTLKILILASVVTAGCCKEEAVEFVEFNVTDFSKPTLLVDSISSRKCDPFGLGYIKAQIVITGELDGRARVTYSSDTTRLRYSDNLEKRMLELTTASDFPILQKGVVNDTIKGDHYYYKLWVKIMPIDCRKGHLKIKTKII